LILDNRWGIEIKSATSIQGKHLKGIRALKKEGIIQNFAVISCDRCERKTQDDITIFPWKLFLEKLWNGEIISTLIRGKFMPHDPLVCIEVEFDQNRYTFAAETIEKHI